MSRIVKRTLTCPKCGNVSERTVWDSINVDLDSQIREKVMSGAIFQWKCPQCGLDAIAPFSTLYHDMKKRFMIYYIPRRIDDTAGLGTSKGNFQHMEGYTYRIVYDDMALREKIRILEEDVNDCAVEFIKYVFLKDNIPEGLPEDVLYRYLMIMNKGKKEDWKLLLQCVSPSMGNCGVLPIPYEMYEQVAINRVGEQMFHLDVDFPEVSMARLDEIMSGK